MEMEGVVIESNFMRCIINDILATESYTLEGIPGLYRQLLLKIRDGNHV